MFSASLYDAAHAHSAVIRRAARGLLLVSGADRRTYLHGLLTNDIAGLEPGRGCYAAYLTPQGRMIADLHAYELGDLVLLVTPLAAKDTVLARLDQFIFSEDVQLGDVSAAFAGITVAGPEAAATLAAALEGTDAAALSAMPEHGCLRATLHGNPVIVARVTDFGVPAWDLFIEATQLDALTMALTAGGAPTLDAATAETLRLEAGTPWFGVDMHDDTIPLEAGIESRAISFNKGCYVGQEVIIRVLHRGHGRVARKLAIIGLAPAAAMPAAGAPVTAAEREAGTVTSAAWSPKHGRPIAMAMLQRDFLPTGTELTVDGGPAVVIS